MIDITTAQQQQTLHVMWLRVAQANKPLRNCGVSPVIICAVAKDVLDSYFAAIDQLLSSQ